MDGRITKWISMTILSFRFTVSLNLRFVQQIPETIVRRMGSAVKNGIPRTKTVTAPSAMPQLLRLQMSWVYQRINLPFLINRGWARSPGYNLTPQIFWKSGMKRVIEIFSFFVPLL